MKKTLKRLEKYIEDEIEFMCGGAGRISVGMNPPATRDRIRENVKTLALLDIANSLRGLRDDLREREENITMTEPELPTRFK